MALLTDIMSWDTILTKEEMVEIEKICSRPRWQWGATADHTAPHKKFWKMDVKGHAIFDSTIPEKIDVLVPFKHKILDYYVNGHTRGLDGFMHKDDADYTFLVFCNPVWDIMWGGKTMFVQDDGRFDCIFPKPGSALCFPSDILHCAEDVSREFYGIRVSAAYKLKKVENTNAEPTDI